MEYSINLNNIGSNNNGDNYGFSSPIEINDNIYFSEMDGKSFFRIDKNMGSYNKVIKPLSATPNQILSIGNNKILGSFGMDIGLIILNDDMQNIEWDETIRLHEDDIRDMCYSPELNKILTCSYDGTVHILSYEEDQIDIERSINEGSSISSILFSKENGLYSYTVDKGILIIRDLRSNEISKFMTPFKNLYCHAYYNENQILLGYENGKFNVFDKRNQQFIHHFHPLLRTPIGQIFIQNEKIILTGTGGIEVFESLDIGSDTITFPIEESQICIQGCVTDDNNLWATTLNGDAYKFELDNLFQDNLVL